MNEQLMGQLLGMGLNLFSIYRKTRDQVVAADPGKAGQFLTDAQLLDLLQQDADALAKHAAAVLAKSVV